MTVDLSSRQQAAQALFEQEKYAEALAAFTVLRKLRARQEGVDSPMYLSNTHSAAYCLGRLGRWSDALPLLRELATTRDRVLGPGHAASIDAKRWWVWACRETGADAAAADLQIEIADALYSAGDTAGAERAMATAVFYTNKADHENRAGPGSKTAGDPVRRVGDKAGAARNGTSLRAIAGKVGASALAAGVTATIEGVVGGFFGD